MKVALIVTISLIVLSGVALVIAYAYAIGSAMKSRDELKDSGSATPFRSNSNPPIA